MAEKSQKTGENTLSPKEQLSFLKYAQVKQFFNQIAYNSVDRSINEKTRHACQEALAYYQGKKLIRVDYMRNTLWAKITYSRAMPKVVFQESPEKIFDVLCEKEKHFETDVLDTIQKEVLTALSAGKQQTSAPSTKPVSTNEERQKIIKKRYDYAKQIIKN